ncbi:hypothetical protein BDW62DRAFT_184822 [Aspergillus aurantiobrunneus]
MARRYEIDELLWLRSSPLITRPANLPPVEEWMGPLPDRTAQRNPANNQNDGSARQPSVFENRHISRNSNSEDIVLGPPKTAFASASRLTGKGSIDATERLPTRQGDSDDPKNDRFNFRDKFFRERDVGDRDFAGREGKMGTFNNRRGEKEDWNNGRPRRTIGQDEQDRRPKRNGEFDRWEPREPRDSNVERGVKDKDGRFFPRRDVPVGRSRHEGSWFRDDPAQDAPDAEEEKASVRSRDWRRDRHGADRDWTRGAKLEQEPEWLDATDRDEPRKVHTQEDFERWKEKMKAGSSQPQPEERKEPPPSEQIPESAPKSETRPTDGEIFSPSGAALHDTTMERFFGLLGDTKHAQDTGSPLPSEPVVKKETTLGKPGKSSRFAGLFSPSLGSPAKEPESPISTKSPAPVNPSTDADQEGFQRILQMLGGGRSHNATPHNDPVQNVGQSNHPPSLAHAEQTRSPISSPSRERGQRPEQMPLQDPSARTADIPLKENLFGQESQGRDSQHLLRLMQQVRVSPGAGPSQGVQNQPQSAGPGPGLMNMTDHIPHPPGMGPAMKGPSFLDDPAIATMQRSGVDQLRRRPTNGPPMGYFEDVPFHQGGQVPITPGGSRAAQGQAPPMGIQRPPGFEHMPPPGWAGHHLPPQQAGPPAPLAPPPGIPTPNRGVNPNYMSNAMPMHGNMPLNERQPFPRGPLPPGMMPPPGYLSGPPPGGFPPMLHNGDSLMGPFDGAPGIQGPPPSSRHLLDMFGQVGGDVRGGMVGPRQFR